MTQSASAVSASQAQGAKPLGRSTAHGVAWTAGATLAAKALGFVGQVVLARLLFPDEWGVVGEALTVAAFTALITKGGIRESLVSRPRQFARWRGDAYWMSTLQGVCGGLLTAAAGPAAAWCYRERQLSEMLLILATAAPFDGLATVPEASLTANLRFRVLSLTAIVMYTLQMGLQVVLARTGFGALSMILPLPLVSAARFFIYWMAARIPSQARLRPVRWARLAKDGLVVTGTRLFDTIQGYWDYTVLGLFHNSDTVGVYFFAYNLSVQVIVLLAANLSSVLFPVLSQLRGDQERQVASFIKAARVLVAVCMPLSLLQALLAGPLIRLVFTNRWEAAIVPLQVLTVGAALRVAGGPANNLIQAQGRFRAAFWLSFWTAVAIAVTLPVSAYWGGTVAVAITESTGFFVSHIVQLSIAVGRGRSWRGVVKEIYLAPVLLALLAGAGALAAVYVVPGASRNDWAVAAVVGLAYCVIYSILLRFGAPALWQDMRSALGHFALRKAQPVAAS
jgi:O-antigen/teichoic acid export membrane protein